MMSPQNLGDLLEEAAEKRGLVGITSYESGDIQNPKKLTYAELRRQAIQNSNLLAHVDGFVRGSVILLHLQSHLDGIVWFWSVLFSGCVPAMSTPFSNEPKQKSRHVAHLKTLLRNPICITREVLAGEFPSTNSLRLVTVEMLTKSIVHMNGCCNGHQEPIKMQAQPNHPAALMLTSGSTGNVKAVVLRHGQIMSAVSGKASSKRLPKDKPFLNWIGLDHVASLTEIHLQAMFLRVDQVHVQAADLIADPLAFVILIDRHRVSRSFAPNFFLAKLRHEMESKKSQIEKLDLSCLHFIASGGEANPVDTCDAVSRLLASYGAPLDVITPGFGMTETCAGAIYNIECPAYDRRNGLEFASLGICIPGIEMRITMPDGSHGLARPNEQGSLEVIGPVVFQEYFNDSDATMRAFTTDGWFRTGDRAFTDVNGNLNLCGRGKEQMTINGVKYSPHEVESSLEEASIPGAASSYFVCFSYRPRNSQTEQICVVYLPTYSSDDFEGRMGALDHISKLVLLQTGVRPHVLPLDANELQKSTLGKLSHAKIRSAFESGEYKTYQETNDKSIRTYRLSHAQAPVNETEKLLLKEVEETLRISPHELGTQTHVFEMGITSVELIKMSRAIEQRLDLSFRIPISTMMTNPTVQSLSKALRDLDASKEFDPLVTLQPNGNLTPLWLVHPGVGEVLVFLPLVKYFPDRPLYALRARGFNAGEKYFTNIEEAVDIYHTTIKRVQPTGPYAIAGYSYGAMLAFETAKGLKSNGDEVRFLGSFNLPPHIKTRMRQLDWSACLLNLAYFLDLMTEQRAHELSPDLYGLDRRAVLDRVLQEAAPMRMAELSLTPDALDNWAGLAYSLQSIATGYEPQGTVNSIDVFYCTPLSMVAASRAEWLKEHISKWEAFVKTNARFHEVEGAHYTMIGQEHVFGFQKTLRMALGARGL